MPPPVQALIISLQGAVLRAQSSLPKDPQKRYVAQLEAENTRLAALVGTSSTAHLQHQLQSKNARLQDLQDLVQDLKHTVGVLEEDSEEFYKKYMEEKAQTARLQDELKGSTRNGDESYRVADSSRSLSRDHRLESERRDLKESRVRHYREETDHRANHRRRRSLSSAIATRPDVSTSSKAGTHSARDRNPRSPSPPTSRRRASSTSRRAFVKGEAAEPTTSRSPASLSPPRDSNKSRTGSTKSRNGRFGSAVAALAEAHSQPPSVGQGRSRSGRTSRHSPPLPSSRLAEEHRGPSGSKRSDVPKERDNTRTFNIRGAGARSRSPDERTSKRSRRD